jgi:hypothetical protein
MLYANGCGRAGTAFVARHASGPAGVVQLGPGVHVVDRQNLSSMVLAHSGYFMLGCPRQITKQQPEVEGTRQQASHGQNMALASIFWSTAHSGCTAYRGPT